MGSPGVASGSYADTAKRLAGRSLLAAASGLATVAKGVSKGVSALTTSNSDKEAVCCFKFAVLEWSDVTAAGADAPCCGDQPLLHHRLPALLVGLESGFQVGGHGHERRLIYDPANCWLCRSLQSEHRHFPAQGSCPPVEPARRAASKSRLHAVPAPAVAGVAAGWGEPG